MSDMPEEIYAVDGQKWWEYAAKCYKTTKYTRSDLIPEWNYDMDAAPRDGNKILVYNGQTCAAYWNDGWRVTGGLIFSAPTHWMPLPKPPQTGGEG